jgi:hypothetical protein
MKLSDIQPNVSDKTPLEESLSWAIDFHLQHCIEHRISG